MTEEQAKTFFLAIQQAQKVLKGVPDLEMTAKLMDLEGEVLMKYDL